MCAFKDQIKILVLSVAILFGLALHHQGARADTAVVAGGCFWCVEADFEKVRGVRSVVSGFAGGSVSNPTYKQVVAGGTGHYEAVKIDYDPGQISYAQVIDLFLRSVDVTDAGGQFCDRGDSYRTAIFATGPQQGIAKQVIAQAEATLGRSIVTPVLGAAPFYPADSYHQDYYKKSDLVLTRFGPRKKSEAYKRYRAACGRDERVKQIWGSRAAFTS